MSDIPTILKLNITILKDLFRWQLLLCSSSSWTFSPEELGGGRATEVVVSRDICMFVQMKDEWFLVNIEQQGI